MASAQILVLAPFPLLALKRHYRCYEMLGTRLQAMCENYFFGS